MLTALSEKEEWIATQIVDIAINLRKQLGTGLLESVYAKCFYYELENRLISYEKKS